MSTLYFDHAATTYVKPEVLDAMMPYFTEKYGNCSSIHAKGREAKKALDQARETIASHLGCESSEIYFTSGGSESDNWAIKGTAFNNINQGKHIITTSIEHHAVMDTCEYLKKFGFEITFLPVDEDGLISLEDLKNAIREDTFLISIMYANNEIGTIQPIDEAARIAKEHDVLFHTDAVQYVGQGKLDLKNSDIDMLSLSAHKLYGPNGVGALYIKNGVKIDNLIHGGAQERTRRAGTENVAGVVGLAKAMELAYTDFEKKQNKMLYLRDHLIDSVLTKYDNVRLNGHRTKRLANNVNFSFEGIDGEAILINLDLSGICCSTGSACTSSCTGPSFVLQALGLDHRWANGSIRLTLGEQTKQEDVDKVIEIIGVTIERLKKISF